MQEVEILLDNLEALEFSEKIIETHGKIIALPTVDKQSCKKKIVIRAVKKNKRIKKSTSIQILIATKLAMFLSKYIHISTTLKK